MERELFIKLIEEKDINMNWLSQQLGCSYVGLSRCYKKPEIGKEYTGKNLDEVYGFIERNNLMEELDKIDFESYTERSKSKELRYQPKVDEYYTLDKESYKVVFVTETDLCLMTESGKLRSMSIKRFNQVAE